MRLSTAIFLLVLGLIFAQTAYYFPILPETVASHFDAKGIADSWMPKESFLIFELIIFVIVIGHFWLVPVLIEKMPDALINLPNKQYWLAPERRTETFSIFRNYFRWFSVGVLLLLLLINQQVYRANLMHQNLSATATWLIIGGFLIFTIVWMIKFIRQFKIKI
ncbi:MAG TPA: DUF1648 domain-containing protein [Pyrinomonadaceae bacterium]|nr:DUF1648 domain-containing protein [Pyrinomonadaceae bacterium]